MFLLLVGRHLCSSDNYQVRFLFIFKKTKNVYLWAGPTDRWRKTSRRRRDEWLSAGGGQALPDVLRRRSPCDPQEKKQRKKKKALRTMACTWTSVCATLWWGTHTCARSNTIAVLGKKLRLKKNKKTGKKGEKVLFVGGSERWRTGEGSCTREKAFHWGWRTGEERLALWPLGCLSYSRLAAGNSVLMPG